MAIANLVVRITADIAEFDKKLASAASSLKRSGKDLESIGKSLTQGLTLPLAAIGGAAAKAAIDFESSFAGIRKTVNATDAQFAEMANGMRELAKTIPINVNELNKLGEEAGQLGIPTEKVLIFTKTMAQLGVTTNLTSTEAADAIARIQNIFGAAGQDTDRLASTLVALGNAGASTEKEITEMSLRIAGAGHTVGLTQAQVLGFASTLASVGINAEAGGSAISRVFLKINDAVAGGGKSLAGFAQVAGMSAEQFKQAFQENAANATTAFVEGLAKLKESGANVNGTIENLIGKNIILKDTLLRLAGSGSLLRDQLDIANKAWKDNTALTKEAEQRFKTTESQLILLKNNVQDVAITLGQAMLPALNDLVIGSKPLVTSLSSMVSAFKDLPAPIRDTSLAFVGLLAAAGPIVYIAGKVTQAWGSLLTIVRFIPVALGALSTAFLALVAGLTGVSTGVTGLTGVLFLAQGALAALTAPVVALPVLFTALALSIGKAWEGLQNLSNALKEGRLWQFITTKDAPNIWERFFKGAGDGAKEAAEYFKQFHNAATFGKDVVLPLDGVADAVKRITNSGAQEAVTTLAKAFASLTPEQQRSADVMKRIGKEALALKDNGAVLTPELEKLAKAAASIDSKAAKKLSDEISTLRDRITGVNFVTEAKQWAEALKAPGAQASLLADKTLREELGTVLDNVVRKFGSLQAAGVGGMNAIRDAIMNAGEFVSGAGKKVDDLIHKLQQVHDLKPGDILPNVPKPVAPPIIPSGPTPKIGGIPFDAFQHLPKPKAPPLDFWADFFSPGDIGKVFGASILRAIEGGGHIFDAAAGALGERLTSTLAKHLTQKNADGVAAIGGFLGGAVNALLPGVGSLLGPLVNKIGSALKNAFGLGTAGRDLVKQFADTFGGFDALHKKLDDLGASGEQLWINLTQGVGKNNPDQAKAAIEAINKAFGDQADTISKTQAVLDEYGISFDQTGEKFRNSTISAQFDELFEKTKILQAAGVDNNLILEKQAAQYSELAKRAIDTNTEIPVSMRPILEQLSEMGLLIDSATGEFIDLGKAQWSTTLTQGFKNVVDAVDRLTDALTNGVGGAIDNLNNKTIHIKGKIDIDDSGVPDGVDVPHFARGGVVRRPTLALIGEAGPEAVVPLSRAGMGLSLNETGGDIYVSIGNKAIDPYLVSVTRKDAARGGLVTRTGSRRRY